MTEQDLLALGWRPAFQRQLTTDESESLRPLRVAAHLRSRILCLDRSEEVSLPIGVTQACGELAVGDWILLDPNTQRCVRRLERESLVARKAAGERAETQLIAANLDTLFIVSSHNHDFNPSRLERYLSLAAEAKVDPVVILTKADLSGDAARLRQRAMSLQSGLIVESVDARDEQQVKLLADWCGPGKTVALVGSSGVGKSTLATSLGAGPLKTQEIREDDAKGRHTTTARSIHRLDAGGLLIDTPGMREIQLAACESGVEEVFDDVIAFARSCRFRDCGHGDEPGCAVQAAIESGQLDRRRLTSYLKLRSEQARNSRSIREQRHQSRMQGKFYKTVLSAKRDRQGRSPLGGE